MKNKFLLILPICSIFLFTACNGDHSTRTRGDTVNNRYGEANDTTNASKSNIDTSKVTTTTGDASSLDNSGSGGTKVAKDTTKRK